MNSPFTTRRRLSPVKIGSAVIDCNDFDKMSAFWAEALHYVSRGPAEDDWVILRDCVIDITKP
jgi:hypothetical protein